MSIKRKYLLIVSILTGLLIFLSCSMEVLTEEEQLEIITKKLQAYYFKSDGTPTRPAYFQVKDADGWVTGDYVTVESFDVEMLLSFDSKPEHFLVTFKPSTIGYRPGIIINNKYYLLGVNRPNKQNPFEERGIEIGNRFFMFDTPTNIMGFAYIKDGAFVDLWNEHIYTKAEIKERLQFLRSSEGVRFTLKHAALL